MVLQIGLQDLCVVNLGVIQHQMDGLGRKGGATGVQESLKRLGRGLVGFGDHNLTRRGRDGAKERGTGVLAGRQDVFLLPLKIPGGTDCLIIPDMGLVLKDYDVVVGGVFFNAASSFRNAVCRAGSALANTYVGRVQLNPCRCNQRRRPPRDIVIA